MTPSKDKRPLPSVKSKVFSTPKHIFQWRIALDQVKVLQHNKQWKDCAVLCQELLKEGEALLYPIHACYLHFYTALSNELNARATHNFSITKIPLLESARISYQAAYGALPKSNLSSSSASVDEHVFDEAEGNWGPDATSSLETPMASPPLTPTGSFRDSMLSKFSPLSQKSPVELDTIFRDLSISKLTPLSQRSPSELNVKKPSPLRIFKQATNRPLPCTPSPKTKRPLPRPLSTILYQFSPACLPSSASNRSITFAQLTDEWLYSRASERYNSHLISFSEMIQKHITNVDDLIKSTHEMHTARRDGRSGVMQRLINRFETDEVKEIDRRGRIENLKKRGWERKRFDPKKYQDLCAKALKEL